jgi:hypothetical protein
MDWKTAVIVVVLALAIVQLLWQTSASNRKVGYRRGVSWYLAQSDTTAPTSTPSYGEQDHTAPVPTRSIRRWGATGVVLVASVPLIWFALAEPLLAVLAGIIGALYLARAISAWRRDRLIERYRPIGEAATKRFKSR